VHVLLPAVHVGRLVGKSGAMIKRIQQHNRSAISISAESMPVRREKALKMRTRMIVLSKFSALGHDFFVTS
jgi:hypothetical protein